MFRSFWVNILAGVNVGIEVAHSVKLENRVVGVVEI